MKIKLTGIDRVIIPSILPQEGDLLQQTTVKAIIELVEIKPDEFEYYGITLDKEMMLWNSEKILQEKEFDITKPYQQVLKSAVEDLDNRKKINLQMLDTCIKIKNL